MHRDARGAREGFPGRRTLAAWRAALAAAALAALLPLGGDPAAARHRTGVSGAAACGRLAGVHGGAGRIVAVEILHLRHQPERPPTPPAESPGGVSRSFFPEAWLGLPLGVPADR